MIQSINWFDELFLSTDLWGWFGPVALITVAFLVASNRKTKPLAIIFLLVEILTMWFYLDLVNATPWYWWNIIIMLVGMLLCVGQLSR